jgi:hypothetical protein
MSKYHFSPQCHVHWIESISNARSRFLLIATHDRPETIEVQDIYAAVSARQ